MQLKKGINMADIISGKSRFNGDRKYVLFADESDYEEVYEEQ